MTDIYLHPNLESAGSFLDFLILDRCKQDETSAQNDDVSWFTLILSLLNVSFCPRRTLRAIKINDWADPSLYLLSGH